MFGRRVIYVQDAQDVQDVSGDAGKGVRVELWGLMPAW